MADMISPAASSTVVRIAGDKQTNKQTDRQTERHCHHTVHTNPHFCGGGLKTNITLTYLCVLHYYTREMQ